MVVLLVLALIAVAVVMGVTAWRLRRTRERPASERRRLLAAFTVCQIVAFLLVVALIVW